MTAPRVFVWSTGQDDNIGDIVLRRRMLAYLDVPVDLYVGVNSDGFVQSLTRDMNGVTLHRSKIGWVCAMMRAAAAGRVVMVANPGEIRLDAATVRAQAFLLAPQLVVRARGGDMVRAGNAVRDSSGPTARIALALVRLSQRSVSLASWRDTRTPSIMSGGQVTPDWAFSPGPSSSSGQRTEILVTFRSDREPLSDAECAALLKYSDATSRTLTVYVQVRRDNDAMRELAGRLGCEFVGWPAERSHADQEQLVRSRLRRAALVVSDRIHALIIGTTEGALPAGVHTVGDDKTDLHLAAAGLVGLTHARSGGDLQRFLNHVELSRNDIHAALVAAAADVDALGHRLVHREVVATS